MLGPLLNAARALLFGGSASTKSTGALGALGVAGGVVGAAWWLIGPGREITLTLNLLELSAVLMAGGFVVLFALWQRSPRNYETYGGRY